MRQRSSGRAPESFTILNLYKQKIKKIHTCCKPQFCFLVYRQPANLSDEPLEDICSTTDLMHDVYKKIKWKQNAANLFVPTQSEYPVLEPLRLPVRQEFSPFIVSTAILTLCLKFSLTTLRMRVYKRQVFPTLFQGRGRGNRHRLVQ